MARPGAAARVPFQHPRIPADVLGMTTEEAASASSPGGSVAADSATARNGRSRSGRSRGTVAGALIVVATLLLPIGFLTVWIREQVLDTNAFAATVGSAAADRAVQREVSDRVSTALIRQVSTDANPSDADASNASVGTNAAIRAVTASVVASSKFPALWKESVRNAHERALEAANAESIAGVATRNGRVVVNLDPVVDAVVAQLPGPIAVLVPPTTTTDDIELFRASDVTSAGTIVRALDDGWWAIPLLSVGLFAGAVAVASRRRRTVLWIGCGIAIASIAAFVALLVARAGLTDALGGPSRGALDAIVDALLDPLRIEIWVTLAIGVALAACALVVGYLGNPAAVTVPARLVAADAESGPTPVSLPGSEPTIADRATAPTPDRTSGRPAKPAPSTSGGGSRTAI